MPRAVTRAFALLCLLLAAAAAHAERINPLPPQEAFGFRAEMQGAEVVISYEMPEGIYLYQDRLHLTTATPAVTLVPAALPPGTPHEDEFFGKTTVYYGSVKWRARVAGAGEFELRALSQGCDEQIGICYPPQEDIVMLVAAGGTAAGAVSTASPAGGSDAADTAASDYSKDEAGYLAQGIAGNNLLWVIAVFFVLGVGLSFTPCVLPMLPILLGIIGGSGKTRRQIILLTAAYIAGVTLAFTLFGILAALSGQLLATAFQQPWLLAAVALVFAALAASLFGAYELRLPAAVQNRLSAAGGGGSGGGAFVMGAVSAVAVSPCVAAPLIGALLYIGKSGDVLTGGVALFSLALGMSVLLAVAGIAGGQMLPKAGGWMEPIKHLFGVLLLGVAVWVASPLLPAPVQLLLYGVLLIFGGICLRPHAAAGASAAAHLFHALAIAAMLWGAAMLVGAAGGSRDVLTPLSPYIGGGAGGAGGAEAAGVRFTDASTLPAVQAHLRNPGKPVLLDFYADWCVSCKEFERFTLRDPRVIARLQNTTLLRADVTANSPAHKELLQHFNLFGPPAILFFTPVGDLMPEVRVIGYENADEFLKTLTAAGI